jgi:hypothetical protein
MVELNSRKDCVEESWIIVSVSTYWVGDILEA